MTPEQRAELKQTIDSRIAELEAELAKDDVESKPTQPLRSLFAVELGPWESAAL